jgi:uncharacterized protein (DUF433 family)
MSDSNVIGAFSEEQAERLSGVTRAQLRRWDRTDFFKPSFPGSGSRAFNRIYSFRDIVSLRVLNQLRNIYNVTMPELRKAAAGMSHLGDDLWAKSSLWVHRGKVVYQEPDTEHRYEASTAQKVLELPLRVAISDTQHAVAALNERGTDEIGKIIRTKYVNNKVAVLAGTRIPVSAIKGYVEAGYSVEHILREFPDLSAKDVEAALAYKRDAAAA